MMDKKRLRALVKESDAYMDMDLKDWDTKMDVLGVMSDMVSAGVRKVKPIYEHAVKTQRVSRTILEKAVKLSEEKLKRVT
jgi:hypothetical protein